MVRWATLKAQFSATGWVAHLHLNGENILCIASISLSTTCVCPSLSSQHSEAGFEGQNSAVTSLSHLLRLRGWLRSTADLRLPGCRSYGLSNLAKVPLRGGAGANSHTRVIWRFIWKPVIYLNSGPSSTKEKIEIDTSVPLINAQQHSWKREPLLSSFLSLPSSLWGFILLCIYLGGTSSCPGTIHRCRTRAGKRKTCSLH